MGFRVKIQGQGISANTLKAVGLFHKNQDCGLILPKPGGLFSKSPCADWFWAPWVVGSDPAVGIDRRAGSLDLRIYGWDKRGRRRWGKGGGDGLGAAEGRWRPRNLACWWSWNEVG